MSRPIHYCIFLALGHGDADRRAARLEEVLEDRPEASRVRVWDLEFPDFVLRFISSRDRGVDFDPGHGYRMRGIPDEFVHEGVPDMEKLARFPDQAPKEPR